MVEILTFGMRGVAVGLALALMLACAAHQRSSARRALVPVLACLLAYLARAGREAHDWPLGVLVPLAVGAILFPLAFWWLVHSAFDDRLDLPWYVALAAAVMVAAGLYSGPNPTEATTLAGDGPHVVQKAIALGFVLSALWRLWRSDAQDLVAERRVLRRWLLAYVGAHGVAILSVELWLRGRPAPAWLDVLNVAIIGVALAVSVVLLLSLRPGAVEDIFGALRKARGDPAPTAAPARPTTADDADAVWTGRLQRLMLDDRMYRDPELSLASLARSLSLPEYRLRELIHGLGFRNFPAYVNGHRLREVEQRLLDPACDRLPILSLALEAGFGSIGPFNRAFREQHGLTPSEFRRRRGALTPTA